MASVFENGFTLEVTPSQLEDWLVSYYMLQHPSNEPSVWATRQQGVIRINYHAPPDGRITFSCQIPKLGKLTITKIDRHPNWDDYFTELVEAIKERWLSSEPPYGFANLVSDSDLANNLTRRWEESERAFSVGAHLSTIVLLGSILEGILLAKVQQNPKTANESKSAPKNKSAVKPFNEWSFEELINVAFGCGWMSNHTKDHSKYLQSYRNLVHPREQIALNFYPDGETCKIAKSVINAAIADLLKNE